MNILADAVDVLDGKTLEIKPGAEWESHTRKKIYAFVRDCGGVPGGPALETNLAAAKRLLVIRVNDSVIAVGAIKTPQATYKDRVSKNSGIDVRGYDNEIGYVCVASQYRRHGLAEIIVDRLLANFAAPLFATTGNKRMKEINQARNFVQQGNPWSGRQDGPEPVLMLYVRP
jgi:hypothetical protein